MSGCCGGCCIGAFGSGRAPPATSRDLIFTAIQIADFTAAVGDYVRYDPDGTAGFSIFFPANPTKDDRVGMLNVSDSMVPVTFDGAGNNVMDPLTFGVAPTQSYGKNGASLIWQFDGSGNWLLT